MAQRLPPELQHEQAAVAVLVLVSASIVVAVAAGLSKPAAAVAAAVGSLRCRRRSGQASRSWGSQVLRQTQHHVPPYYSLYSSILLLLLRLQTQTFALTLLQQLWY